MVVDFINMRVTCRRLRPHIFMVLVQMASAFLYFITEAAFNHGMNPHVYVTYRHIVGGIAVFPFAYFLERKTRPKMTLNMFVEIFLYSLLGVGLTINMYFASLQYTSPAFLSATVNTIPTLTFILAVIFRLETLNLRKHRGLAKATGTLVSLAGVMVIALYRGPAIRRLYEPPIHLTKSEFHKNWIKGPILSLASCISWSIWFTMQGFTLKRYPAPLSLATWANFIGALQSAAFTSLAVRHQPAAWVKHSFIDIATILFGGVVSSALNFIMIVWSSKEKGPVFVTMFCPLQTLLVVIFAYFIVGEKLYTGSIIGGVTIIIGLYLLLWGKAKDQEVRVSTERQQSLSAIKQNEPKMQIVTVPEKESLDH
ncbi:WAT1-related protein At1g43650-like [Chenopodium quinoa]|uniref:WAT1-related protein n=1 Tax=Chenopodium quinoa TaxID=63459 RepID=A0A803LFD6_CHEQI|nr:WAT1-related protein At1g43650-like [Chenopodium quinoa]